MASELVFYRRGPGCILRRIDVEFAIDKASPLQPLVLLGDAPLPIEGQLPLPTDAPRSPPPQVAQTAAAMAPPYGIQDVLLPVHVKMELSPPPSAYSDDYHHHHDHPERPEAESSPSPPPPQMLRSRDDDSTSLCGSTSDSSQFMGFDPEYLPQPIYEDISDPEDGEPPHHRGPRFARENGVVLQFAPNVVARPAAGSLGGALCERLRHHDDGDDHHDDDAAGHRGEEVTLVKSEPDLDVSISDPIEVELKRMFNSPTPPPPPPPPVPCSSPLPALARCSPSPPSSASSTRSSPSSSVSPRPPPAVEDESSSILVDSGGPLTLCCLLSPPLPPCSSSTPSPPPPCPYTTPPSPCPSTDRPYPSTTPPCSSTTPPLCPSTSPPCPSASPPTLQTPTSSVQYESPTHTPQPLPPSSSPPIQTSARSPCSSSLCSLSPAVITSVFSSVVQSPSLHSAAYQSRPTPSSASSPSPPLPPMRSPHTPPSLPSPSPPYSPPTPPPASQCSLTSQTCPSKPGPSGENFFLNKEDIPTGDSCTCKSLSIEKRRKSAPELSIPLPVIQLRRKERASSWTYADSDFNAVDKRVVESKVGNYFQRLKFTRANSVWKVVGCENCNRDTNCKSRSKLSEPSETLVDLGQCSKTMHEVGYLSDDNTGVCQEHNKSDFETQSKAVLSVGVKDTQSDKDTANVDISYDEETQLNISGDSSHDNSVTDGCVVKDSINTLTKSISDMCNTNETCEVISRRDTVCDINEKTSIVQNPKRLDEDDINSRDTSSYSDSSNIQSKDCECEDISETEIKSGEENVTGGVAVIQANGDRKKELETGNQDFIKENNCNNEYEDDEDNEGELKIDEDRLSGDENEQKVIREVEISPKAKAENSLELLNCKFQNSIKKNLEPENKRTIDVIELSDDELESNQSPNVKKGADSITNSISRVHVIQSPKCIASHVKKSTESSEDKKMISGSECTQDKQIMKDKELSIRSDSETGDSTTSVLEGDSAKPHEENYTMLNEKTDSIQEIVVSEEIESQKVLESGNEQSVVTEPSAVKRKLVKNDDVGIPLKSRKLRPSRRNFRHDNIKMFKVSSVKPTPPPWMYRRKSLSAEKQEKSLSATTQSSGASADKHIGSVNEGCVEKESSGNEGSSETRNEEVSKGKRRHSLEHSELLKLKKVCRSASDASDESQQPHGNEMSVEEKDEKEEKDEGLKDSKRKKRKSLGEQSVVEEVSKQFVSHQMQEKGRRLAQEIPGFNWLEEKIRSGGVPMNKPHVKRSSTETQSSSLTKEVISDEDGSKTNGPSESSVQVTGGSDENSSSKGPSQSIVINTGSIAPVQQNRAPVIVSTRQLGNIPERMDPLLKQLTSGGDLEITISRQTNQGSEMSSPMNESDANEPSAIVIPATTVSTNGTTETVPVTITFPTTFQGSQAIVTSSTSVPTISQTSPFIVSALQGSVPNVLNSVDSTQRLRVLSVPQERVPQTNGTENRLNVSLNNSDLEQRPAVDIHPNIQILPPNAAPLSNASRQTNAATESREQAALSSQSYNFPPYSSTHMNADNYNFSQPSSHTSQSSLLHPHYFQQTALNVGLHPSHHSHLPHAQSSRNALGPLVNEVPQPLQQTNQIFREQLVSQPPKLVRLPQPHTASNSAQLGNLHQQSPSIQLTSQVVENNARVQQMPPLSQPVISSQQSRYSTFYPSISSFSRIPESHNHSQSLHFHRPQIPHLPSSSAQVAHPHVSEPVGLPASTQLPPLLPLSQTAYPALPPLQPQFTQAAPDNQAAVRDPTSHLQNEARHNDYLASLRMQQNLMRRNLHLNPSHQYNSIHTTEQPFPPPLLLIQPQSNAQQMLGRQMLSSGPEETRTQPAPKSPNSDYSDCLATMARHAAAAVDTGLGTGLQPPVYQNERIRSQIPATTAAAHLPTSSQRFCDVTYASRPQPGRPTAHPEKQGGQNASALCEQTSRVGGIDENVSDEDIESLERLRHITNKEIEEMPKCLNEVQLAFKETARNLEKEGLLPAGTKDIAQQSAPHHRVTFQHTPVNGATLSAAQTSRSSTVSAHASSVLPSHSSDYSVEQQTPIFRESRTAPACTSSIRSDIVPDTVEVPVTLKLKHSVPSSDRTENKTTLTAEAAVTENVTAASVASITARTSTSAVDVTCPETFITVTAAAPVIAVGTAMSRLTTATAVVPGGTITASSENIKESRIPMAKNAVLPHVGPSTSSSLENRNEQNTSLMVFNRELPNRDIAQIQNSGRGAIQIPHSTECTVDGSVGGEESAVPISISSDSRNERSTLVSVGDQDTRRRLSNTERYSDINESPLDLSVGSQRPKEINELVTRRPQVSDSASSVSSLEEHRNLPTVLSDRHVCAADIQNDFSQLRKHLLSKNAPLAASSESFPELEIVEETYPPDPKHQDLNSISNRILGEDTLSTKRNFSTEPAVPLGPHAVCVLCRRSALFVCSLCNQTKYCSKYCQGSHWMFHKRYCTRICVQYTWASLRSNFKEFFSDCAPIIPTFFSSAWLVYFCVVLLLYLLKYLPLANIIFIYLHLKKKKHCEMFIFEQFSSCETCLLLLNIFIYIYIRQNKVFVVQMLPYSCNKCYVHKNTFLYHVV
ncbi:Uncharacterized protein GBIM_05064 [Gryllus bimaculatus]|nr:Uncharacterized protein GBIM_05064 [Gryllus bimaculatus]